VNQKSDGMAGIACRRGGTAGRTAGLTRIAVKRVALPFCPPKARESSLGILRKRNISETDEIHIDRQKKVWERQNRWRATLMLEPHLPENGQNGGCSGPWERHAQWNVIDPDYWISTIL
jgi:hypothetical protein